MRAGVGRGPVVRVAVPIDTERVAVEVRAVVLAGDSEPSEVRGPADIVVEADRAVPTLATGRALSYQVPYLNPLPGRDRVGVGYVRRHVVPPRHFLGCQHLREER